MANKADAVDFTDLRGWLSAVGNMGGLRTVQGATWQQDIGEIAELITHREGGQAIICDDIPGYPPGYRVLVNALRTPERLALAFRLPPHLSRGELTGAIGKKMSEVRPLPPVPAANGPILENVDEGDAIDVLKFPTPQWHEKDGGRYIGTACYVAMRDPESGKINLGAYRAMVDDAKHIIPHISQGKDGRIIRDKYFDRGEPCPLVFIIGGDPLLFMAGATDFSFEVNEYDWVGGIRGRAVEVITGKYTGLPIAADAEIALEGFLHKDDLKDEGPFGEWPGYYARGSRPEPRMELTAVYHRNDPILCGAPPVRPPSEATLFRTCLRSYLLKEQMEKAGVRNVVATWFPEPGGSRLFICVAIKQSYPGHAVQAGHIASQCGVGAFFGRYVVVVGEDIDVTNMDEVLWAMCTRSDPATSIDIIRRAWSTGVDPRLHPDDRAKGITLNSRAIIDATKPFEWKDRFPPESALTPEARKLAIEKWGMLLK